MIKHRFSLGLLALAATMLAQAAPMPALAQGISQKVAVCNPDYTSRCVKPDASGNTPVTGTLTPGPSENHIGEVGGNTVNITVAQTVTASSAYTSGNAVGGLITLTNASRVAAGSGLVQSVINYSKSAQTGQVDVFLFNANPSASTCTDKTAFVLASADFDKVVGVAHITDWTAGNVASVGQAQNLAVPFSLASGTTAYACAVSRSTPTYSSTSDVSFGFRILRN